MQKRIIQIILHLLVAATIATTQSLRNPILSVNPSLNATGISLHTPVKIGFSTAMLPGTLNPSSVMLYGDRSGKHFGTIVYDQGKFEISITPKKKYIFGEQLQCTLTDSVGTLLPYQPIVGGFSYKFVAEVIQGKGEFAEHQNPIPSPSSPFAIAVGDFNGDGYSDAAVTQKNSATVSVYLNTRRNRFFSAVNYSVGTSPEAISVADLTGDGFPDIIVANRLSNSVSLLLNNGAGAFTAKHFPIGKEPVGLAVADCDNDGVLDIGIVSAADSLFRIYRYANDSLTMVQSLLLGGVPSGVLLDDLNNDGYLDGAISLVSKNSLVLLKNDSTGRLSYDTAYTVGSKPISVIAYDAVLGPDGYVDLATINNGANNISILKNDTKGRFQGPEHFAIGGTDPVAICGNDFDGDGDVDLAISNRGSKSVVIFRNKGVSLPDTFSIPLANVPQGIAALDITGTYGIMDLIVCNTQTGTLSILRNSFFSPPSPELYPERDTVPFTPTALIDTNTVRVKLFSALTPTKVDSIRFFSNQFTIAQLLPVQIASYDSLEISLKYIPVMYGVHRDSAIVYSTAGINKIYLIGESPPPTLTVSTSSVDFGGIKIGETSYIRISLKNLSLNSLSITSVSKQLSVFSISSPMMPMKLSLNDSASMMISFTPDSIRMYRDTLRIICDPIGAGILIPLQGKGESSMNVMMRDNTIPSQFMLGQNFPNPFNPRTTISFGVPFRSAVRIDLYDIMGRKVSGIFDDVIDAGFQTVQWNGENVSSGVYYYRMVATSLSSPSSTFTGSKKLLLLK